MVIDIKDDFGNLTYIPSEESSLSKYDIGKPYIKNPRAMLRDDGRKRSIPNCTRRRF